MEPATATAATEPAATTTVKAATTTAPHAATGEQVAWHAR
jgi:hypothetical protein